MFEPLAIEEKIIAPKPLKDQIALRQSYFKGHVNAIRTHVRKARQSLGITSVGTKLTVAEILLEKQLTKVERDAHDMFEIMKKAIK